MNNHARPAWTQLTLKVYIFTCKRLIKLPPGEGYLGYPRPYKKALRDIYTALEILGNVFHQPIIYTMENSEVLHQLVELLAA